MSRAGSAWSSRPRIWRCSPRWCRACGTARSRPTRCSWARSGWAARYGPWPAWSGGWRRPRARASAASSARRGRGSRPAWRGSSSSRWTGSVSSPAASRPDVGVVIVAAGAGVRAGPGEAKQFRPIHGVPMLLRALRPFTSHPEVVHVVVALPVGHVQQPPDWLAKLGGERLGLVPGGETRAQSVRAGLRALTADATVVLVHDAARPLPDRRRGRGGPVPRHGPSAARRPARLPDRNGVWCRLTSARGRRARARPVEGPAPEQALPPVGERPDHGRGPGARVQRGGERARPRLLARPPHAGAPGRWWPASRSAAGTGGGNRRALDVASGDGAARRSPGGADHLDIGQPAGPAAGPRAGSDPARLRGGGRSRYTSGVGWRGLGELAAVDGS